ncbi:MAG: rhodanese-like domain-containing protein [Sphingomonadaceae bacterium]|nr:rhodanese-like domain-containing protein [Sphingomonadaceae bacterium]
MTLLRAFLVLSAAIALMLPNAGSARTTANNPQIDFAGHIDLAREAMLYRQDHLLPLGSFRAMAARENTLLLDARSAEAFRQGHMEGAVNLPLPDFTAASLADIVGTDRNRAILIYCNNNFSNNEAPVVRKAIVAALNIQTMTNLFAYGYRNVFELGEVVDFRDAAVGWVGDGDAA